MIDILKNIHLDIYDFYKQSMTNTVINKQYVEKKYLDTKRLMNIELENYKYKKNKYDPEIYKDEYLIKKKLENELNNISSNFKNNIFKHISNIKDQKIELDKLNLTLQRLQEVQLNGAAVVYNNHIHYLKK